MSQLARIAAGVGGLVLLGLILYDLFQTVILPRPAVRKVQMARYIVRPMWMGWRWVARRSSHIDRSEARLAAFGPISLAALFLIWGVALVTAFGLIIFSLGDQFRPALQDFQTSFYVSATTLVPLSYGDFVPEEGLSRWLIITESATGVGFAAVAITLLFSLYESFRAREESVIALDAMAGAPPSAVQMLETAAQHGLRPALKETFDEWRKWSAMVLESHLAYPLLVYFRSSHDNEAWINSFSAVMDAAALVLSTIEDEVDGNAKLMLMLGNHLVEDFGWVYRFKSANDPIIEREEYKVAVARLKDAGYRVKEGEEAWTYFAELRSHYASILNQVANLLLVPPAPWVGDRSYLPHRQRRPLRLRRRKPAVPAS